MAEDKEEVGAARYDIVFAKMHDSDALETLAQSEEICEETETIRLLTEAIRDINTPQYHVYATS